MHFSFIFFSVDGISQIFVCNLIHHAAVKKRELALHGHSDGVSVEEGISFLFFRDHIHVIYTEKSGIHEFDDAAEGASFSCGAPAFKYHYHRQTLVLDHLLSACKFVPVDFFFLGFTHEHLLYEQFDLSEIIIMIHLLSENFKYYHCVSYLPAWTCHILAYMPPRASRLS